MSKTSSPARWTSPGTGLAIVLFSVLGIISSIALIRSELDLLGNPDADLLCDVNPLIGCSSSLLSPQAHLLGVSNSVVGLAAFSALFALGFVLLLKGSLPRIIWWGMTAGAFAGLLFVVYFLHASVSVFQALCPYCMVTWVATLGALPVIVGAAGAAGAFGEGAVARGRTTLRYSWALVLILYLIVILVIVITMSDKLAYLF